LKFTTVVVLSCLTRQAAGRRQKAQQVGRAMCAAMRDKLGRQQFEVVIQAAASGKVVARETLKARPRELYLQLT